MPWLRSASAAWTPGRPSPARRSLAWQGSCELVWTCLRPHGLVRMLGLTPLAAVHKGSLAGVWPKGTGMQACAVLPSSLPSSLTASPAASPNRFLSQGKGHVDSPEPRPRVCLPCFLPSLPAPFHISLRGPALSYQLISSKKPQATAPPPRPWFPSVLCVHILLH